MQGSLQGTRGIQDFLESIHTSRLVSTDLPSMPSPAFVRDGEDRQGTGRREKIS